MRPRSADFFLPRENALHFPFEVVYTLCTADISAFFLAFHLHVGSMIHTTQLASRLAARLANPAALRAKVRVPKAPSLFNIKIYLCRNTKCKARKNKDRSPDLYSKAASQTLFTPKSHVQKECRDPRRKHGRRLTPGGAPKEC